MMDEVLKILGICIIGSAISIILKPKSGEYSFLIALATGIIALTFVINSVVKPINEINDRLSSSGVETEYFKIALKSVGIAYITDFVADGCRDAGLSSIASKAELVGKTAIFTLSVPLMMSVLETAIGFIK
jgi:stage III sporulation protein AD